MMMSKIILKLGKEVENPVPRNTLFRTTCKTKDRVCKIIVDSGIPYNLVSIEMVENLELERVFTSEPVQSLVVTKGTSSNYH
jgi:hypothetical protein